MLANIRFESPYTLIGTTFLLEPTLYIRALSQTTIYNAGSSTLEGSYVVAKARATSSVSHAALAAQYVSSYQFQYDRAGNATLFPAWNTNKILPNTTYFGTNGRQRVVGKEVSFSLRTGQRKRITIKNSVKLTYADYAGVATGIVSGSPDPSPLQQADGGYFKNKTMSVFFSFKGEEGQVCGVTGGVTNTPILTSTGAAFMAVTRVWYQYKWAASNNKPTYYGSNFGASETVDGDAYSWVGVPELKAMRAVGGDLSGDGFGALDNQSRHQVDINPRLDCAGDDYIPHVHADA